MVGDAEITRFLPQKFSYNAGMWRIAPIFGVTGIVFARANWERWIEIACAWLIAGSFFMLLENINENLREIRTRSEQLPNTIESEFRGLNTEISLLKKNQQREDFDVLG